MHTYLHAHLPSCTPPLMHTYLHAHLPSCTPPLKHTSPHAHLPSCTPPLKHTSPHAHLHLMHTSPHAHLLMHPASTLLPIYPTHPPPHPSHPISSHPKFFTPLQGSSSPDCPLQCDKCGDGLYLPSMTSSRCQPCPQGTWRKAGLDYSSCVQCPPNTNTASFEAYVPIDCMAPGVLCVYECVHVCMCVYMCVCVVCACTCVCVLPSCCGLVSPPVCPEGKFYSECGPVCRPTCANPTPPDGCPTQCVQGCFCPPQHGGV